MKITSNNFSIAQLSKTFAESNVPVAKKLTFIPLILLYKIKSLKKILFELYISKYNIDVSHGC